MSTKYLRELLESVDVLNPERACEGISEALQELRQVEADRAKDAELIQRLVDALEWLVYLEFCNDEGLSSGAPTSKDWKNAFDKAQQQIEAASAAGFKPSNP